MLTFEVASFDIGYNCIQGRPFLLKFTTVIHTAYATIKMSGPKGIIILKSGQPNVLACENATLTHAGWFGEKKVLELAAKLAKAHRGSTLIRTGVSKPPAVSMHHNLQRRITHSWALHQTSPVLIKWWMRRRKGC
jgi:hypothetical protein